MINDRFIRDPDTARRLLAVRVVSEALFNPGEEFMIVSPNVESANKLADAIAAETKRILLACALPGHLVRGEREGP